MGREKARMPNQSRGARAQRRQDPTRPPGPTLIEAFRCTHVEVAAVLPPDDDFPDVEIPQLALVLVGHPAHLVGDGAKRYLTFLDGPTTVAVAAGMTEAAQQILAADKALQGETAGGVIISGDVAGAAAAAEEATRREQALRKGD